MKEILLPLALILCGTTPQSAADNTHETKPAAEMHAAITDVPGTTDMSHADPRFRRCKQRRRRRDRIINLRRRRRDTVVRQSAVDEHAAPKSWGNLPLAIEVYGQSPVTVPPNTEALPTSNLTQEAALARAMVFTGI